MMKDSRRITTPAIEDSHGTDVSAWCDMGRDSLASGDLSEALWHLRQAVENDSDYVTAWRLLGQCFEQMGEEARAQRCFRVAFRLTVRGAGGKGSAASLSTPLVRPRREPRDA